MNVKEFQAGQTGICPVCGVKMPIPLESTRPSSRQKKTQTPTVEPQAATPSAEQPASVPTKKQQSSAAMVFAASPNPDPLDAAASVVWYVRSPGGGQFGPATTNVLRNWLAEGRLNAESLVWCEGWSEWQEAGNVFPQLSGGQPFPGLETIEPEPITTFVHSQTPTKAHVPPRKTQLIAFGALAFIFLILIAVFFVIWVIQ